MLIGLMKFVTALLEIATSLTLLAMTVVIVGWFALGYCFCVAPFAAAKGLAALPFIYEGPINLNLFGQTKRRSRGDTGAQAMKLCCAYSCSMRQRMQRLRYSTYSLSLHISLPSTSETLATGQELQ